ncbi:MAG: hypothetical protein WCI71_16880, partial [Bacteroidota bacterium]
MKITWKQLERLWYITALCVIIASLPFSKYGQSFGQFMITGGWIVERFDIRKLRSFLASQTLAGKLLLFVPYSVYVGLEGIGSGFVQFFKNKPALIFSSILLLHVAGLIITTDFDYAVKDIRTKFPLFLLPLFFSTSEAFDRKGFQRFMLLFILAALVRSVYNAWLIQTNQYIDIRDVSRNVSHIIFGLLLTMGIYSLLYFIIKKELFPGWLRILFLPVVLWFLFYLILSRSFTGIAITVLTLMALIPIIIFKTSKRWMRISLAASVFIISTLFFFYFRNLI